MLAGDQVSSHGGNDRRISDLVHDLLPLKVAQDVPELFAALSRSILDAIKSDACLVSVLDGDGRVLRDIGASVVPPARLHTIAEERYLRDNEVNRAIIEDGGCAQLSVSANDIKPAHQETLLRMGFSRVLICPLVIEEKNIGTIEAYRTEDQPYRADDADQVALLVEFASSSYQRLQLASKLEHQYTVTLEALAAALEAKDPYTQAHTGRIRDMAAALAVAIQVPAEDLRSIRLGAILHDVGKIGVVDAVLQKPGPLTSAEWAIMRMHPELGERMLKNIDFIEPALPIIRHHHEWFDGTGYPDGLVGQRIPLGARIVSVCDAFDAMTTDRPYRSAMGVEQACEELGRGAGRQFDPLCAELLIETITNVGPDELEKRFVRYVG